MLGAGDGKGDGSNSRQGVHGGVYRGVCAHVFVGVYLCAFVGVRAVRMHGSCVCSALDRVLATTVGATASSLL